MSERRGEDLIGLTTLSGVGTIEAARRLLALATIRRPATPTPSRDTVHFIAFLSLASNTNSRSKQMNQAASHKSWFVVFVPKQAKHP